jgi:hypothetical protein
VITEAIREAGNRVELSLVPNPDPYVRDVEVPRTKGHIDFDTTTLHGGVFEHRVVELTTDEAGPDFWWDLNNTLIYRGDTIESIGNKDARFLSEKDLKARLETGSGTASLVMKTDFLAEFDDIPIEESSA